MTCVPAAGSDAEPRPGPGTRPRPDGGAGTGPRHPIYLDHHSTTPTDARVVAAMLPYFEADFGNAASRSHAFGWRAEAAVQVAREQIAAALGTGATGEWIFTSGATESNNLALLGGAVARMRRGRNLVTVATEHPSVLEPLQALAARGFTLRVLPVDGGGLLDPAAVAAALTDDTSLVSVMAANHEIGVLQPLAAIGAVCRERGVPLHCDASQAVGKIPLELAALPVDLVSCSAHKCYGPKGIGALWVRGRELRPEPLFHGGGHQGGLRSGTLPVPLIVGFGRALEIAAAEREVEAERLGALRERLWRQLREGLGDDVCLHGHPRERLPGNLNVGLRGLAADAVIAALPDLALSSGSACTSADPRPSHVLRALGLSDDEVRGSLRIGLGRSNGAADVDRAAARIVEAARALRDQRAAAEGR